MSTNAQARLDLGDTPITTHDSLGSVASSLSNKVQSGINVTGSSSLNGGYNDGLTPEQLHSLHRNSGFARKIINTPVIDALRNWRMPTGKDIKPEQIQAIQMEERRLGVRAKIMSAYKEARLYGGCTLVIGNGEANLAEPLDPDSIKKGGLLYLTKIGRQQYQNLFIDERIGSPTHGSPLLFHLSAYTHFNTRDGSNSVRVDKGIHPSRLIVFSGEERLLPQGTPHGDYFWGDSTLQSIYQSIIHLESVFANINYLVYEARVSVLGIEKLLDKLAEPGGTEAAVRIIRSVNEIKGTTATVAIDKDQMEYSQHNYAFAGLPEIIEKMAERVAGQADIPITKLFGSQTTGLSNSGAENTRNYYDGLRGEQDLKIAPPMHLFNQCLINSALGGNPTGIDFNWQPLYSQTPEERSRTVMGDAKLILDLHRAGLITDATAKARSEQLLTTSGIGENS